jgi:hypothetical protein
MHHDGIFSPLFPHIFPSPKKTLYALSHTPYQSILQHYPMSPQHIQLLIPFLHNSNTQQPISPNHSILISMHYQVKMLEVMPSVTLNWIIQIQVNLFRIFTMGNVMDEINLILSLLSIEIEDGSILPIYDRCPLMPLTPYDNRLW